MPYVQLESVRCYYETLGHEGPPMVLLHGAMGAVDSPNDWLPLGAMFARRYRCHFIEHRGHGRTDNPSAVISYPAIAQDVAEFIETLSLQPAIVCGMSDGAIVGLELGMRRPHLVSALVCVGANYHNDALVQEANRFRRPRLGREACTGGGGDLGTTSR